jgi:drug/metabolite transporter (DMT)-like permease
MASGLISVASPLLASGSVLAFALAVAAGERPSRLAVAGCALAVTGAVLTSVRGRGHEAGGNGSVVFAFLAAIAFGFALFLLGRASEETGSAVAVLFQRFGSLLLLAMVAAKVRPRFRAGKRLLAAIVFIGLGTAFALLLYALAATRGMLSIVSILSSMYPVVTVLLAHAFLGERLHRHQLAGAALGLVGISVLAAAR